MRSRTVRIGIVFAGALIYAHGQWLNYPTPGTPRTRCGKDTVDLNDKGWLDAFGHARTESLRIQERFRHSDFGHMEVQVTVDDPTIFTKQFTIKVNDSDILESICDENEKDRSRLQ